MAYDRWSGPICSRDLDQNPSTHVKTQKLLQVYKQVVTSLFTSCRQVVFALLVPSCSNKFGTSLMALSDLLQGRQVWNKLLTTSNNLVDIIRLVARLSNKSDTIII